jgi:DNA-binding beta-propeller fold protein YncE
VGALFLAVLAALGFGQYALEGTSAAAPADVQAPMFEVDPLWPKPLPNHWLIGSTIGVTVDSRDHVFIIHRPDSFNERTEIGAATSPKTAVECCVPAPPVLEFDPEGNLVGHWGGKGSGYDWPSSNHGITADDKDNLWIGGNGGDDAHMLVFSRDGKFLKQYGKPGVRRATDYTEKEPKFVGGSQDQANFGRVAKIAFDAKAREAYVADGYLNKRVAVIDMDTGKFKRFWGAYGNKPDDADLGRYDPKAPPAKQFRNPVHCAEPSNDGLVYVCDRPNDRIQVFQKDGKFLKEAFIQKETLGDGSVWDIAFSKDPQQKYIYLADGKNQKVYVIDRQSLEVLTSFGDGGRQPGQFFAVHSIATDSKGNIYTTETYEGKRVQKFAYQGLGAVKAKDQGTVWPKEGSR